MSHIQNLNPCTKYRPGGELYDKLTTRLGDGRTVAEIMDADDFPASERIWLLLYGKHLNVKWIHNLACDCSEISLLLLTPHDLRSIDAVRVARRYAAGTATYEELVVASKVACEEIIQWRNKVPWAPPVAAAISAVSAPLSCTIRRAAETPSHIMAARVSIIALAIAARSLGDLEYEWQLDRIRHYINGGEPEVLTLYNR